MPRVNSAHTGPPSYTSMFFGRKTSIGRARHPVTAGSTRASQGATLDYLATSG